MTSSPATGAWPSISVVIPTRDRPELLRETLDAIRTQDYPGVLGAIVVYDRSEPDGGIVSDDPKRPVQVTKNERTPGAAGARNTGAVQATTDLVAFCDDTDLFLDGKWVKATPAFNLALCRKFRVKPLEFDGREDSIFHPFDEDQRRHMEYLRDRGRYADVPVQEIQDAFREAYPKFYGLGAAAAKETFG